MGAICNIKTGNSLILNGDKLIYNGKTYELPEKLKGRSGRSLSQINDKVYIDEYEFKDGQFKFSLIALFHKYF